MSRDWTPRETFFVNLWNVQHGREDFFASMESTVFCSPDGRQVKLYTQEEMILRRQYPLLGMLFEEFPKLYDALSKKEGGIELLNEKEKELDAHIQSGLETGYNDLTKWFEGQLDEGFYYRERNNEKLFESIMEEASVLPEKKESLDSKIQNAASSKTGKTKDASGNFSKPEPQR